MQTNPILDVLDILEDAGFEENQRMAITKSISATQNPLLEEIKGFRSEMVSRFDKMDAKLRRVEVVVYGILLPVLFIVYKIN